MYNVALCSTNLFTFPNIQVSYDAPSSAQVAIRSMNGMQVLSLLLLLLLCCCCCASAAANNNNNNTAAVVVSVGGKKMEAAT
jgi:hypothetical protein